MKRYAQIIFLSTTDTFLSPLAEAIYKRKVSGDLPKAISRGQIVLFEEPINPKCNLLLTKNSFPITGHSQTKGITKEDIKENSLVITMTLGEKVKFVEDFGMAENVYTIGEFVGLDTDLLDPVGLDDEKYQECFEEIVLRIDRMIQRLY